MIGTYEKSLWAKQGLRLSDVGFDDVISKKQPTSTYSLSQNIIELAEISRLFHQQNKVITLASTVFLKQQGPCQTEGAITTSEYMYYSEIWMTRSLRYIQSKW